MEAFEERERGLRIKGSWSAVWFDVVPHILGFLSDLGGCCGVDCSVHGHCPAIMVVCGGVHALGLLQMISCYSSFLDEVTFIKHSLMWALLLPLWVVVGLPGDVLLELSDMVVTTAGGLFCPISFSLVLKILLSPHCGMCIGVHRGAQVTGGTGSVQTGVHVGCRIKVSPYPFQLELPLLMVEKLLL
ncbi:Xanthine/uracil permease family protein [Actinidia rufa]|uniref:Xanthine/uracil permease family protein n=1 Tax=Actinidia rufa TaxID=165716 RepID=A0A7J0G1S3_9ERIC|nr:Xanthine/uracil permease family protein [Actinidia rufa]